MRIAAYLMTCLVIAGLGWIVDRLLKNGHEHVYWSIVVALFAWGWYATDPDDKRKIRDGLKAWWRRR